MIIKRQWRMMKIKRFRNVQQLQFLPLKKRHRGCSFCIMDIENSPIPEFPTNQVVVGVISLEDVIEELLKEEILDETDEYVNIHNKIKVNMSAEKLPTMRSLQQALDASSAAQGTAGVPAGGESGSSITHL